MSGPLFYDRVRETTVTTGSGTITLAGAVAGYQSFSVVANGNTCYYCIAAQVPGEWEVGIGTYTSSGTTLSRTTILASSNSGSAVNFSAGTKDVFLDFPAALALPSIDQQCRLYSTSGTPVPTSDTTTASTIYVGPYNGELITLLDANDAPRKYILAEISLALSGLTSGKNYDVFVYSNSGTLTIELSAAWTNDTTRADAIATVRGLPVKSSDHTRLLVGTIRTTGTTSTTDVAANRLVFSWWNRVPRHLKRNETAVNWTYTTATIRQANANTANQLDYVTGDAGTFVESFLHVGFSNTVTASADVYIGLDSTTTSSSTSFIQGANIADAVVFVAATYRGQPGLGKHSLVWLEQSAATGTSTWRGSDGGSPPVQNAGIMATIMM